MKTLLIYTLLGIALVSNTGCDKDGESLDNSCERLSNGLVANDAGKTGQAINQLISKLVSSEYSGDNLNRLAEKMSAGCGINTTVTCLNCNHVTPPETELTALYSINGVSVQKIIVITQTSANKMVFKSMHD